jgi:hypothetical protein
MGTFAETAFELPTMANKLPFSVSVSSQVKSIFLCSKRGQQDDGGK